MPEYHTGTRLRAGLSTIADSKEPEGLSTGEVLWAGEGAGRSGEQGGAPRGRCGDLAGPGSSLPLRLHPPPQPALWALELSELPL